MDRQWKFVLWTGEDFGFVLKTHFGGQSDGLFFYLILFYVVSLFLSCSAYIDLNINLNAQRFKLCKS